MSNKTTKLPTQAQVTRQKTRSYTSGMYTKLNPCDACGKSAGANYYSDERCDTNCGKGLVLCCKCATRLAKLSDAEYAAFPWKE